MSKKNPLVEHRELKELKTKIYILKTPLLPSGTQAALKYISHQ